MTRRGFFGLLAVAPLALMQGGSVRHVEPEVPIEGVYPETLLSKSFFVGPSTEEWDAYERYQWRYWEKQT